MGRPDGLRLVVRAGDLAPGARGDSEVRFLGVRESALNSAGDIVFPASLIGDGITEANNRGIFASVGGGEVFLVVQEGDELEVSPGVLKTLSTFAMWTGSGGEDGRWTSLDDLGTVAFLANFTDGTAAVMTASIPAPATSFLAALAVLGGRRRRRRGHTVSDAHAAP